MSGAAGIAAIVAALALGASAIWAGTDGLRAFTAETARRLAIERAPRPLPEVALLDQDGQRGALDAYRGRVVLVEFIYASCPTVCSLQGAAFERLRERIAAEGLDRRIALLTLSFDIERDGPAELAAYAERFGGPDRIWHFARPDSHAQLQALLQRAGVIVLPDGYGGFVHNAAIHVVDARGRLVRILDSDATEAALALARRLR
ncbi:SCO family protein [Paracoccus sp. (in: a-proteobacteria)]|uniref:SCO family protein n=1 Tax=Paracoccus sp. TaxID=267 RepID=UPI00321FC0AC